MGMAEWWTWLGAGRQAGSRPSGRIGDYRVLRQLGRGGMGEVWLGRHRTTGALAAIKIVRRETIASDLLQHDLNLRRLQREARAIAKLRSPYVVRLLESGASPSGDFYYAMEFLDGLNADALVRAHGALDWPRAVEILRDVCAGLEAVHASGIVHCDVSPGNIVIAPDGGGRTVARLIDFGLVRFVPNVPRTTQLSVPLVTAGTPAYMAPELIFRRAVDQRTDIYAWGCLAFWLLTARTAFDGDSPIDMALAQVSEPPRPPSWRTRRLLPPELDALVLQCVMKDPAARPQSMADVMRALDALPNAAATSSSRELESSSLAFAPHFTEEPAACDGPVA